MRFCGGSGLCHPVRWEKLRQIPDLKAIDEASKHWLKQTLESMAA